jgi:hypothetical protein
MLKIAKKQQTIIIIKLKEIDSNVVKIIVVVITMKCFNKMNC